MSELWFKEVCNDVYKTLTAEQYLSEARRAFGVKNLDTSSYSADIEIIGSTGHHPTAHVGGKNNTPIRRPFVDHASIDGIELREKIQVEAREYAIMQEKGKAEAIKQTLTSSIQYHQHIESMNAIFGAFKGTAQSIQTPYSLLGSDRVVDGGTLDWKTKSSAEKSADILNLANLASSVSPNRIMIGKKAWVNLISKETSEAGKIGVVESIKMQLGVGADALFMTTDLLDIGNQSHIVVYNDSAVNQELIVMKNPYIKGGLKENEEKRIWYVFTHSIIGGLAIYKDNAIAKAKIQVA